jgi:RimJ/RimL family protein N-acetyltransferase
VEIVGSNPIGVATRAGAREFLTMDFHPPEELRGEIVTLRRYRLTDRDALKAAIAASLESLRDWMPWAQAPPTDASVATFLVPAVEQFGGDAAANYAITLRDSGHFAGGCSLMPRVGPSALEIGYWVHSDHHRRGIATESARLLTNAAFGSPGVRRVEIHCDQGNAASAGVARGLGYRLDRVQDGPADAAGTTGRMMIWITERPV